MQRQEQWVLARANELRLEGDRFLAIALMAMREGDSGFAEMLAARADEYFQHAAVIVKTQRPANDLDLAQAIPKARVSFPAEVCESK
jgi:hypothetical protein